MAPKLALPKVRRLPPQFKFTSRVATKKAWGPSMAPLARLAPMRLTPKAKAVGLSLLGRTNW